MIECSVLARAGLLWERTTMRRNTKMDLGEGTETKYRKLHPFGRVCSVSLHRREWFLERIPIRQVC
jgi:hypothetical protein